ncbi:hypothetical protein INT48_008716 [Thamnidium elegans]|uniref:Uncharacterized protein n=1 Tax=Thamnidium elegans TaxID=101142 RepID=A0A8H7VTR5_9FUNG|nr:hypothetical protein INT48_008716 [Thamnidium elegans]
MNSYTNLSQKLSGLASNAALSISEIIWSYIADNTKTASNPPPTASGSPLATSSNNPNDLQSFLEYSDDLENDIHIIDLSDTVTVNVLEQTLNEDAYDEIKNDCALKVYPLTKECGDLLERMANCPPALSSIRKLLMDYNNNRLDPSLHYDYEFIHDSIFHSLKLCESPMNPISQTLRERTAATWTSVPTINSHQICTTRNNAILLDIIELKWIQALHLNLDNSKTDGLAIERKRKSMVIIIEFSGGSNATQKQNWKVIVLKFTIKNNTIFFESLTIHNQYYVRKRHLKLSMPQSPRDLKSFVALLPTVLSCCQAVIDSVE